MASKEWKLRNPDRVKELNARSSKRCSVRLLEYGRRRYAEKRDHILDLRRKRIAENRAHHNALAAARRAAKKQATPSWANAKYIALFYEMAALESQRLGFKVEVDHIIPLVSDVVCGFHCEDNMQLLLMSDNRRKSNRLMSRDAQ